MNLADSCIAICSPLWNTYIALTAQQPFRIKEAHELYGKAFLAVNSFHLCWSIFKGPSSASVPMSYTSPPQRQWRRSIRKGKALRWKRDSIATLFQSRNNTVSVWCKSPVVIAAKSILRPPSSDKHQHLARKKLISRCFSPSHQAKFLEGVKELSIDLNRLLARKASESVDNVVDVYHLLWVL